MFLKETGCSPLTGNDGVGTKHKRSSCVYDGSAWEISVLNQFWKHGRSEIGVFTAETDSHVVAPNFTNFKFVIARNINSVSIVKCSELNLVLLKMVRIFKECLYHLSAYIIGL